MNLRKKMMGMISMGLAVSLLAGCGATDRSTDTAKGDRPIIVGAKDFTESMIIAEVYALALEDAGYQVERTTALGNAVIREAIESGDIDLYPEYTGTSLVAVLGMDPIYDPQECYETVKKEYKEQLNLDYLDPSAVNDSQGLAMTSERAKELGIQTISDAWEHASDLVFSCKAEFLESPSGYLPLKQTYGDAAWKDTAVMEHALSFSAAQSGDVDVFSVYTTEGGLAGGDYVILEDDKAAYAPFYLAPVVRPDALEANPGAEDVINAVTKQFTTEDVIQMNAKVDLDGQDYGDVAGEYYDTIKDKI